MTEASAIKAIFDRWTALFPTLAPGVAYTFEDVKANEPDDALMVHVAVVDGDSDLYTIGPHGTQQRTGYIEVQITGPSGRGRGAVDAVVDATRQVYERKRFAQDPGAGEYGIVTFSASAQPIRKGKDAGQLRVMQVRVPVEWYEST